MKCSLKQMILQGLEISHSIGEGTGWSPVLFRSELQEASLITFIKHHSYGEYIFDWDWARAYEQHGLKYYPKLTSMIPFTPLTTSPFLKKDAVDEVKINLFSKYQDFYQNGPYSSSHFLFLPEQEINLFKARGYLIRESMQYHFRNDEYQSFDDFLSSLKSKKAKNIRKERNIPAIKIERLTGIELNQNHSSEMYQFYLSTTDRKNAYDYLKEDFFHFCFREMKDNILYVRASEEGEAVAGALFFYDEERLYGRYWGKTKDILNLHFELCYYQGIDFCIEKNLKVFEAGAQGEHKIPRGFRPVKIFSAHHLKEQVFHAAVARYIQEEKEYLAEARRQLADLLPFKNL